jgi:hypothetical protein
MMIMVTPAAPTIHSVSVFICLVSGVALIKLSTNSTMAVLHCLITNDTTDAPTRISCM